MSAIEEPVMGEICGNPSPSLRDLNEKAIKSLYDLLDKFVPEQKADPAMITAVTDAIAKLNQSLKASDILPKEETKEEREERERQENLMNAMKG